MWPLFMVHYDLPPTKRYKFKYLTLMGLYFGTGKANMNMFLKPICSDLQAYSAIPLIINNISVKTFLLSTLCDLPAKALVLKSKKFNGQCGCHSCEQIGNT
eukprot:Pompholyxophrys_sp_v1_NODE_131_length_1692_cov_2.154551.p5 type:complete len:101 gc:universal NODE_131_length_1692_cov_2.154551:1514-1212(-)